MIPSLDGRTIEFLGLRLNPLDVAELTDFVAELVKLRRQAIVANHNLHSLYLFQHQPKFRQFFERAAVTHIDGMPLIALARLYGFRLERRQRVTYVDWTRVLMQRAATAGWRVFYLGSPPGVAARGAAALRSEYRGLDIQVLDGYFDAALRSVENLAVLRTIEAYGPDLLMVGMGMPRQEHWIVENLERLPPCAILACGAAMDYIAGASPTPPRWAGRCGLEWLFRLGAEPGRLWRRYLLEPWAVLWMVIRDLALGGAR